MKFNFPQKFRNQACSLDVRGLTGEGGEKPDHLVLKGGLRVEQGWKGTEEWEVKEKASVGE